MQTCLLRATLFLPVNLESIFTIFLLFHICPFFLAIHFLLLFIGRI